MEKERKKNGISWKGKKRIAEVLCVFVVAFSMVLSLEGQIPQQVERSDTETTASGSRIENNGSSVSLKLDSRQERGEGKPDSADEYILADGREIAKGSRMVDDGQNLEAEKGILDETETDSRESAGRGEDNGTKNNVVKNDVRQSGGKTAKNTVVKNAEPLTLVSSVFENHGQLPKIGEAELRYQYPVEIGYSVDKNYDGKQIQKDSVLSIVMDTVPEEDMEEDGDEISFEKKEEVNAKKETETEKTESVTVTEAEIEKSESKTVTEIETEQEVSQEQERAKENEQEKREEFRDEIWTRLFMTEPIEVKKKEKLKVEEEESVSENLAEGSQKSETVEEKDIVETSEETFTETADETVQSNQTAKEEQGDITKTAQEEEKADTILRDEKDNSKTVEADAGYYVISGKMRDGKSAFVSDILIKPSGVDGFDKVRLGKDGEFRSSIRITEDAVNKDLELYFTDGERITEGTTFTYTKDTWVPEITADEETVNILSDKQNQIYCTNDSKAVMKVKDGEQEVSSGIEKISCVYGDKIICAVDFLEEPVITLPENFFGRVLFNCEDKAGNTSDIVSRYYLVEQNEPEVTISNSEICSVPYTLWIDVSDAGQIVSGIENMECMINGEPYAIDDLKVQEKVRLADNLEVMSKVGFPITFKEEGSYQITLRVTDYAGNVTTAEKMIDVTQPDLVAVYMPKEFTIHIDPQQLLGREQIFSDDITLDNVSNVDVKVQIEDIDVKVNDEVSDTGVLKDCDLYLVAPDTGEKIPLKKGNNRNIYSYCLPMGAVGDIANLHFIGDTTEGSDQMWESSDISIDVKLNFCMYE